MVQRHDELAQYCIQAISSAAKELGTEPLRLAQRLDDGRVARLVILLNAALPHLEHPGLRHRIEDLLSDVTGGRMPMSGRPESELDWALRTLRRRRRITEDRQAAADMEEPPEA